ncbi:anti-sigma factor family protein [Kiloniella laminariae]|uniref:anti-sigma factor family protein n=1 Tax=Kiloniella laminariae TaxID=454162 RepID=UPI00037E4320|nr:anti-sigma factor [Kiloniella laminariae]
MTDLSIRLSAYLDGELDAVEALAIEALLDSDPEARAELDALMAANTIAQEEFSALLKAPIPLALAQKIKSAPIDDIAVELPARTSSLPRWGMIAASLALFVLGGTSGYFLKDQRTSFNTGSNIVVANAGWLAQIADYHAVYSGQKRHLVEVAATESDHLQKWLGTTVGASFSIPDLTKFGLTFEGGRLLVANGKPVGQLMYRQADGTVIALCLQKGTTDSKTSNSGFKEQTIKGFDFVSWNANGANYVVIGPGGLPNLSDIAAFAATEI